MSRYYPTSRGASRGSRGTYYQSSYGSRGGGGGYESRGGGGGGYYDSSRGVTGDSTSGRYYPSRDRRESAESGGGGMGRQLEIAKKLVDQLMQSQGGSGGSSSTRYGSSQGGYKRPRDESYDRERSSSQRSRYSERDPYYSRREEGYTERRPSRHDDGGNFHAPAARRPFRGRGYAPRRGAGYVRGGPPRRHYDQQTSRDRSFQGGSERPPRESFAPPAKQLMVTKCPHCHARCATFADYRKHQLGREHMAAMRKVLMKIRAELGKIRLSQREAQKELEGQEAVRDPEAFEALASQYCTLCRLSYKEVEGVVHNETEWHRKQRTYQNPSCKTCNMTFPARIAYEKHTGTFTHIQKVSLQERRAERHDAADFQAGDFMTVDSVGDVDEEAEGARAAKAKAGGEPQPTATQKLAELTDYDGKKSVGSGYMRKTEVYHCGLCDIYIKITAKVNAVLVKHCMGKKHFENYKKKLAELAKTEEKVRKEEEEEAARGEAEEEAGTQEEAGDTSRDNGLGQEAAGQVKSEPGEAAAETQPAEGWEAGMDDNFLLGEDQEEEPKSAAK